MNTINSYFNNVYLLIELFLFSMILITSISVIRDIYDLGLKYFSQKEHINDLYLGVLSLKDIEVLSPKEFEKFCMELLEKDGYNDIHLLPLSEDLYAMQCKKGTDTYFVECIGYYSLTKKRNNLTVESLRRHIGVMEGNNYTHSLVITTGTATKAAHSYVETLPDRYSVEIIDGDLLVKKYEFLRSLIILTTNE